MSTADVLGSRWLAGDQAAGNELAASMTADELRKFGVEALVACCTAAGNPPAEVLRVVEVGRADPRLGHVAFDAVRNLVLEADASSPGALLERLLWVAEDAAKNIYNSTNPDDPFDADAGERLVASVGAFCLGLSPDRREPLTRQLLHALASTTSLPRSKQELEAVRREKLLARWAVGDPATCKALVAGMTDEQLRTFAVEALAAACAAIGGTPPAVLKVIDVGRDAPHLARAAFDSVRELSSRTEAEAHPWAPATRVLRLAAIAAQVIYNSSKPQDPFEPAPGQWLLGTAAALPPALPPPDRQTLTEQLWLAVERASAP